MTRTTKRYKKKEENGERLNSGSLFFMELNDMLTRTERFYHNKLQQYFNRKYLDYADVTEYYVNPKINIWKFIIRKLGIEVTLTCDNDGVVTEIRKQLEGDAR